MATFDEQPGYSFPEASFTSQDVLNFANNNTNLQNFIDTPKIGEYTRQMLKWKIPKYGWITMFLNPENISIKEGKQITTVRTKAGYIVQYAGEQLTEISLNGTTGSAGMEGINVIRSIYRSEQIAFDDIAEELNRTGPIAELLQLNRGTSSIISAFPPLGSIVSASSDIALNILSQPFPTLASLAVNIEMYFQGLIYRGYFTSLNVTESSQSPGIFEYNLLFTAYARQGARKNFMPWHRQPYSPLGADTGQSNPLSYSSPQSTANQAREAIEAVRVEIRERNSDEVLGNRSLSSASDGSGNSLAGIDFRDLF
jgi:hypothetical protein